MAFTYLLNSTDATLARVARVRLALDDTVAGSGPRPDGRNLSDEEILVWLADEGDSPLRAAAAACEMLSRSWAKEANRQVGQRREDLAAVAAAWATRGKELRASVGSGTGTGTFSFSGGFARDDGYAEASS